MGFSYGKYSVFGRWLSKDTSRSECPEPDGSSRTHHRPHRHRTRRFHVPRQALGVDYESYDLAGPPLPPSQPVKEPRMPDSEPETLSDQDLVQQPARRGLRIFAWILWIALVCANYKAIIALWKTAALSWLNVY
jgi:hypothetical protein